MKEFISKDDLLNIIIKSKKKNEDLFDFKDDIISAVNSINNTDNEVVDISMAQRSEDRWNVILTLDNDEELLYSVNLDKILNI